ncbi:MAG: hypothetical protein K8R59_02375 [Thermoanaerobaculales bacterium]|nr:hypothetical protein [Thermoanaerobaculales bacterium]
MFRRILGFSVAMGFGCGLLAPGASAADASYDAGLRAPACLEVETSCDTTGLVAGVGEYSEYYGDRDDLVLKVTPPFTAGLMPNVGSPDMLELFTSPEESRARSTPGYLLLTTKRTFRISRISSPLGRFLSLSSSPTCRGMD